MSISSVVPYWFCIHGVAGSIPCQVNVFFFHAASMLFYTVQKISIPKICTSLYGPIESGASVKL
jgi:hypothetical protein